MEESFKQRSSASSNIEIKDESIKVLLTLFEKLTEEEKEIACKFPLSDKYLKKLCIKRKCVVQGDCANLLIGIEKKILLHEPDLKTSHKSSILQAKTYKWYQKHLKASKKYCEKHWKLLDEGKKNFWMETKVHNLIKLGIHPKLLWSTYNQYGNFSAAIKYLDECESKNYNINQLLPSPNATESDTESEKSIITVINTQNSEDTEYLMGKSEKSFILSDLDLVFNSEEIIETLLTQTYDEFNNNGIKITSTQKTN